MLPKDLQLVLDQKGRLQEQLELDQALLAILQFAVEFHTSLESLERKKANLMKECAEVEAIITQHQERTEAAISRLNQERVGVRHQLDQDRQAHHQAIQQFAHQKKVLGEETIQLQQRIRHLQGEKERTEKQLAALKFELSQKAASLEAMAK